MGGRKAQVALFVLAGLILLFMVVLAIYLVSQKRAETATTTNEQLELQNNPELAAEKARMQERVDKCLEQVSGEAVQELSTSSLQVNTIPEAESALSDEISAKFPDCFFRYNTAGKLTVTADQPKITVSLGADQMNVHAEYGARGELDGKTYTLKAYDGAVPTQLRTMLERGFALSQALSGATPTGSGGKLDAASLATAKEFIDDDCYVNLYAYEDQGIYADLLTHDDGTLTAYFFDYKNAKPGELPPSVSRDLPKCVPKNTPSPQQTQNLVALTPTCPSGSKTPCPINTKLDTTKLPEGFTIISALDINPLTLTLNASQYPPGDYFAVAQGTDANGVLVSQPFTITIT
jgi:hypothetical protein